MTENSLRDDGSGREDVEDLQRVAMEKESSGRFPRMETSLGLCPRFAYSRHPIVYPEILSSGDSSSSEEDGESLGVVHHIVNY